MENPLGLDPALFLGPLGMPGLTAYSSVYGLTELKKGDVVFISAASGAVGQLQGQLAKVRMNSFCCVVQIKPRRNFSSRFVQDIN